MFKKKKKQLNLRPPLWQREPSSGLCCHLSVSVQVLAAPLLVQPSADETDKAAEDGLCPWTPTTPGDALNEVPGSWTECYCQFGEQASR